MLSKLFDVFSVGRAFPPFPSGSSSAFVSSWLVVLNSLLGLKAFINV